MNKPISLFTIFIFLPIHQPHLPHRIRATLAFVLYYTLARSYIAFVDDFCSAVQDLTCQLFPFPLHQPANTLQYTNG